MSTNDSMGLADEDAVKKILVDSVLGLWDVVNNLTRLKPSTHERYRVTVFGSARVKPGTFGYEETKRAAAALAEMGCDIITGGGPGLMQAPMKVPPPRLIAPSLSVSESICLSNRKSIRL